MNPSNPSATGSAGPAFESKVGAACLVLLLTRGGPLCLGPGTLHTVHLQAGHLGLGWHTDDILLEATNLAGNQIKAALQVKRAFSLGAKDVDCVKVLHGALADFRNTAQFDQQNDVIGLITSSLSATMARGLRTLLDCARASTSAEDMARRLAIPKYLGKTPLEYFSTIREILDHANGGAPNDEELWHFLCRFQILDLDFNVAEGSTETMMRSLIAATLSDSDPSIAHATWNELVALALADAGEAMSYKRDKLPPHILQRHTKATGYPEGVSRLLEDTQIVTTNIRTTIANSATIPRVELVGHLSRLIEEEPLVFVTGEAGSGKSALVKTAFKAATQGGIGFAFRAVSLAGNHINEVFHPFGLTLDGLRAQTSMHPRKVIWVDSLERLMEQPAEQRLAFLDLLRALKSDSSWRLVVTCRDYSAETVRTALFSEVEMTPANVEVGELSETELNDVARLVPSLERPLGNQSLRRLLKNPFFLDKAAKMDWKSSEPLPTNERMFREKVWREVIRRVDEDAEIGLPKLREQALVEVALRRAKALEAFVPASHLDSRALHRLVRDSVLDTPHLGSDYYAPAHDVFEDWALMQWLDEEFIKHDRDITALISSLGTYPALRRAYRKWLTERLDVAPEATDSLVLRLIQNPAVAAHWREDTLVGVLLSRDSNGFLQRNAELLLADSAKLLRHVIHTLRVACRAAIPKRLFGIDSEGVFFLPKGNGWIGAAKLMEDAIPIFGEADFMFVIGFLEDWILLTRLGISYPNGARAIANVAWHWLPRVPWRSPVEHGEKRLLKIFLAIPLAAEPKLSETVALALADSRHRRSDHDILELIFSHFNCGPLTQDIPDLEFRVAEHILGLNRALEEIVAERPGHTMEDVSYAFGLGMRFSMDDFPASAYQGPYLQMLTHQPKRGIDFILKLTNKACEAYSHPENRFPFIEPPTKVTMQLPDGVSRDLCANARLWHAYRGMSVTPYSFQSALMALEKWLLGKAEERDPHLKDTLLDLLRRTNNVAVVAVVASVAVAHPSEAGEAGFSLLTSPFFLMEDLNRSAIELSHVAQMSAIRLPSNGPENACCDSERAESDTLPHRQRSLEDLAVDLQWSPLRDRIFGLIDAYKASFPPEAQQDGETKTWRLRLHMFDTRNFEKVGKTPDGRVVFQPSTPAADLQKIVDEQKPRSARFQTEIALFTWGRSQFDGRAPAKLQHEDWHQQIRAAKEQMATTDGDPDETSTPIARSGPAYVAAVCIRDHWSEMSQTEQEWCAITACDAVEADADTQDYLAVAARNPMEASRPAAFILPALFNKTLPPPIQARLLPALAKSVLHSVEETVNYALQGIGYFLWKSDRQLALSCMQALISKAQEEHAFLEWQRRLPFAERGSKEIDTEALCSKLRCFIQDKGVCDENEILSLDLTKWPGRALAQQLFSVLGQQQDDPLAKAFIRKSVAILPAIWEQEESDRHNLSHYDHLGGIEHLLVETISRFVLRQPPEEALENLAPIFNAAARFPEKTADFVKWLILEQKDRKPAGTLWALWQRFADDFASGNLPSKVDDERSDAQKLLHELFLGNNWGETRNWPPLDGESHRLNSLFDRLPATRSGFECYAYFLAKAGSQSLPGTLIGIAAKLSTAGATPVLNELSIFCLEQILTRLIYGGNSRIRIEPRLRTATLSILDHLVASGSSVAYKLRDDFLTPF